MKRLRLPTLAQIFKHAWECLVYNGQSETEVVVTLLGQSREVGWRTSCGFIYPVFYHVRPEEFGLRLKGYSFPGRTLTLELDR